MKKGTLLPVVAELLNKKEKIRVACVGDSITEGWRSSNPSLHSYPAVLQTLVGDRFEIKNYGIGGSTVMRCSDMPFRDKWGYIDSIADRPDLVILMMGTNDCNREYNIRRLDGFYADFVSLINEYHQTGAEVIVMTSPELFCNVNNEHIRRAVEWQKEAAEKMSCGLIDINGWSHTNHICFPDDIHCDDSGYAAMAYFIANSAFNLSLYDADIKTVPFSTVVCGKVKRKADKKGEARFSLPAGEYTAKAFLSGYKSNGVSFNLESDASYELVLEEGGRLLSENKPVTSSSAERGNPPENAVNGKNDESRWASLGMDNQHITVDLQGEYSVTGVYLNWEQAYASSYEIQVSADGESFITAATVNGCVGGENEVELVAPNKVRFVRMLGLTRGTIYGFSLYDFKVFGE